MSLLERIKATSKMPRHQRKRF